MHQTARAVTLWFQGPGSLPGYFVFRRGRTPGNPSDPESRGGGKMHRGPAGT